MSIPLEERIIRSHRPLMTITSELTSPDYPKKEVFENIDVTVGDKETLRLLEIDLLFDTLNHTQTKIGAGVLYRSLAQPFTDLGVILARQEALRDLGNNRPLRLDLEAFLALVARYEEEFFNFVNGRYNPLWPSKAFKDAKRFIRTIVEGAGQLPTPDSLYLRTLVEDMRNFRHTNSFALVDGPVYRTCSAVKSKDEVGFFSPAIKFYQRMLKPGLILFYFYWPLPKITELMESLPMPYRTFMVFPLLISMLALIHGPVAFDDAVFARPLSRYFREDPATHHFIDDVGKIDEMMSLYKYVKSMPTDVTLPTMGADEQHYFVARNIRNPIKARTDPAYVPNYVELRNCNLTFITGPNSGGKTDHCITIAQSQIMAQIGSYIAAESADISIADRIFYQAPMFSQFQDEEGRLGAELKRSKDIFYHTSPRTLVVLDELMEATRHKEKVRESYELLEDFAVIGNNVVLVTHNDDLVDMFNANGRGKYLQVEFRDGNPTYRLVPGISRESHADRILQRIGFTREDRRRYIAEKGYPPK